MIYSISFTRTAHSDSEIEFYVVARKGSHNQIIEKSY